MNLNLNQLATLRALSRCGTMLAAASELSYTAGAVSQQIAALEKSLGIPLIARLGRNVILTDSGRVLAEHAGRILLAEQAALDAVRAIEHKVAGPLLLGTFGSTAAALMPPIVAAVQREYPRLELSSTELDVDEVITAVQRGHVDAAFGLDYPNSPMARNTDIEMLTLCTERFGLAVAANDSQRASEIRLTQASDWDFIIPPADTYFGRAVRVACRQHGFEPRVRHEVIDTAASLALAGRGLGATFVTDMMVSLNPAVPICRVGLTDIFSREIVLMRLAGSEMRPTVNAIAEIARDVVASRNHPQVAPSTVSADASGPRPAHLAAAGHVQ